MSDVKEFVIDRDLWDRGCMYESTRPKAHMGSELIHMHDQKMCCLGFYLQACGIPDKDLIGAYYPSDLPKLPEQAMWLVDNAHAISRNESDDANDLVDANDTLVEAGREETIAEIFKRHDITVIFTGKQ